MIPDMFIILHIFNISNINYEFCFRFKTKLNPTMILVSAKGPTNTFHKNGAK